MQLTNKINEFLNLINQAKKIVVLTGAGISTESGLPDFRSDDGFWTKNKPVFFKEFLQDEESRKLSWIRNFELKESFKTDAGFEVFVKPLTYKEVTDAQVKTFEQQKMVAAVGQSQMTDEQKSQKFA